MLDPLIAIGVIVVLALGFYFTRGAGGRLDLSPETKVADMTSPRGEPVLGGKPLPEWSDEEEHESD
jgi:hypothetical protein